MDMADGQGLAHPRAYGNFPRVIAEYVKKRRVLTLEDAVRKMSGWPAQRMVSAIAASIREGMRADMIVFDLDKLQDTATFEQPIAAPTGIDDVIVNGVAAIEGRQGNWRTRGPSASPSPAICLRPADEKGAHGTEMSGWTIGNTGGSGL